MSSSTASPALVLRRYFLSQMSSDAGCRGMSLTVSIFTASRRAVLMPVLSPFDCGRRAPPWFVFAAVAAAAPANGGRFARPCLAPAERGVSTGGMDVHETLHRGPPKPCSSGFRGVWAKPSQPPCLGFEARTTTRSCVGPWEGKLRDPPPSVNAKNRPRDAEAGPAGFTGD